MGVAARAPLQGAAVRGAIGNVPRATAAVAGYSYSGKVWSTPL